ncbi:efflux RND transporter periplasmic adaptor subunit [Patescibacteria group bacterium]
MNWPKVLKKIKQVFKKSKQTSLSFFKSFAKAFKRNLFRNLFLTLLGLFLLIIASSWLEKRNNHQAPISSQPIPVHTFQVGTVPSIQVLGRIEKTQVVQVRAQTNGIVNKIYVKEGSQITARKGALIYLATNYQGGNISSLQRQLAQKQYQFTADNYDLQKDLLSKQKELASSTETNFTRLREISESSLEETRSLLDTNQDILNYFNANLENYEATDSSNLNRDLIAQTKQLKSSFQAAANQISSALRSLEYQTDTDAPPSQLATLQKDLALKQLAMQEKSLDLNKEITLLQLRLTQIQESLSFPPSPVSGIIQKVHVKTNDFVSPGQPLFTIQALNQESAKISILVSADIAQKVSTLEKCKLYLDQEVVKITPSFISSEATDGTLHTIVFYLPEAYSNQVTSSSFIKVDLPLGISQSGTTIPVIPIDSVYQTNQKAFVFVSEDGQAKSKEIQLGEILGQFVTITSGLDGNFSIITDRYVIDGDLVKNL